MRKIAQLCIALLIFAAITAVFVSGPEGLRTADTPPPGLSVAADSRSSSAPSQHGMQLRLDTRLAAPPQQIVLPWYAPVTNRIAALRKSDYQRPFWFLGGTLVLGLLTGWLMRQPLAASGHSSSAPALTRPGGATVLGDKESSQELVNAALAQQAGETSQMREENLALRDTIESHEIAQHDYQERLTDHQATIAELRNELGHTAELNLALQAATQQQALFAEEIEERDMVINNLHADVANWQERSQSRDQRITGLDEQILELSDTAERAQQDGIALEELVNELQDTRDTLAAEIDVLKPQAALVSDLNLRLEDLDDRYQQSQSEQQVLAAALKTAESQAERVPQLQLQITEVQEQVTAVEAAHDATQASLQDLQDSHAAVLEQKVTLDEEYRQLAATHAEQSEVHNEILQELEVSKAALTQQEYDLKLLQESLDTEKAESQTRKANLQELRILVDQANTDLQRTEQDLESTNAELVKERDAKQLQLEQQQNLQNQLDQLNTILEGTEESNEELSESLILLREDLAAMANKISEKNDSILGLQTELANSQELLSDKQAEATELVATIDAEHLKLEALQEDIAAARDAELRLASWDNSLQSYRHEVTQKNRLIDDLRDQLSIATHSSDMLKRQIREMDGQIEMLIEVQSEAAGIAEENSKLNLDLEEQNATIEEINSQHRQHGKQLDVLLEAIEALQYDRGGWENQLHDSTQALVDAQEELTDNYSVMLRLEEVLSKELLHTDYATTAAPPVDGSIVDRSVLVIHQADSLRESLDAANMENKTLLLALDEQTITEQERQEAIDDLHLQIKELTQQHDAQESNLHQQTQTHEQLQQDSDQQVLEIEALQHRIQENEAQLETLESGRYADQERMKAGQKTHEKLQRTSNKQVLEIENLQRQIEGNKLQLVTTREKLVQNTAEIKRLQKHIAALRSQHGKFAQRLKTKAQSLKENFLHEHRLLEDRHRENSAQLKGELADLKDANEQLLGEVAVQREKLSSLNPLVAQVPVLRAKITSGNQPGNIPVLGRDKRKESID